jgi:hypothetical protein
MQHESNEPDSLFSGHIREANHSSVGLLLDEDDLPEIGVDSHKDSTLSTGSREQGLITRIGAKRPGFDDIVTLNREVLGHLLSRAPINQESHFRRTSTASIESLAMTLRA